MTLEPSRVIEVIREMHLFSSLDEAELNRASLLFTQYDYPPDTIIFSADEFSDGLYIVLEGEVLLTHLQRANNDLLDVLVVGDFFGEESLLTRSPSQMSATTVGPAILLKADPLKFNDLITRFHDIQVILERVVQSRELIRQHHFPWLNEDEVVYQARRKHEAFLMVSLLWPAGAALVMLLLALGGAALIPPSTGQTLFLVLMGFLFVAAVGWALWIWLDWSNDYYVVTSQRVVWVEKVIMLYESRIEAPHSTIQAVKVNTGLLGRFLGYGNVTVSTFTGNVDLLNVGEPYQMAALVEEHWHRAGRNYQSSEKKELDSSVRRIVRPVESPGQEPVLAPLPVEDRGEYHEPSWIRNYFGSIFEMRFEEGSTITYRKHWIMLLAKAWKPLLTAALIIGGLVGCSVLFYTGDLRVVSPEIIIAIGLVLLLLVVFPWWLYNYIDWRNDIYQITDKNIFDIERKPLGTETRKSGSLERIISLAHQRPGFIGYILNVGNVVINFGDANFTFDGVYEPARVQQEIFMRMHQLRLQQQKTDVSRERDRIMAVLESYHRIINEEENDS